MSTDINKDKERKDKEHKDKEGKDKEHKDKEHKDKERKDKPSKDSEHKLKKDKDSRSRPRSRDRKRSKDKRSRSRSRERRRSKERRSRSRSGDRKSRKDRHSKRDKEDRSKSPRPHKKHKTTPPSSPKPFQFVFTASQVSNRLCEVYAAKSKTRIDDITQCFDKNIIVTSLFASEDDKHLLHGIDELVEVYKKSETPSASSEPCKRVLIQAEVESSDPTFSLDFYNKSKSPGLGPKGIEGSPTSKNLIAFYRVQKNVITQVWVLADDEVDKVVENSKMTKENLKDTKIWEQIVKIVRNELKSKVTIYYNNYSETEDNLGLGLGSSSVCDTWSEVWC